MTTLPARASYTDAERRLFAAYAETRARFRPDKCSPEAPCCWVKEGPPAADKDCRCQGCHDIPLAKPRVWP